MFQDEERVPAMTSGALLVTKINPPVASNRLSSPPYNARNGALPPIGSQLAIELEPHSRYQVSWCNFDMLSRYKYRIVNLVFPTSVFGVGISF